MTIAERVNTIIGEQLGVDAKLEASFIEDLGADSLDRINLMMACEEEFGITIPDRDAEAIVRVLELVAYIERQCPATT